MDHGYIKKSYCIKEYRWYLFAEVDLASNLSDSIRTVGSPSSGSSFRVHLDESNITGTNKMSGSC